MEKIEKKMEDEGRMGKRMKFLHFIDAFQDMIHEQMLNSS